MLSSDYRIDEDFRGKSTGELKTIAREIQTGRIPTFDHGEVREVIIYMRQVESIKGRDLLISGVRWLGPPLGVLIGFYILLFWLGSGG